MKRSSQRFTNMRVGLVHVRGRETTNYGVCFGLKTQCDHIDYGIKEYPSLKQFLLLHVESSSLFGLVELCLPYDISIWGRNDLRGKNDKQPAYEIPWRDFDWNDFCKYPIKHLPKNKGNDETLKQKEWEIQTASKFWNDIYKGPKYQYIPNTGADASEIDGFLESA